MSAEGNRVRQAAKSSAWLFAGKTFERAVRLFVVIVLARALDTRGFGVFSFAFAFVEMFAVFTDAGMHAILVREIAKDRGAAPRLLGNALLLKALLSGASWLAACLLALWTVPGGEALGATLLASFTLFLSFRVVSLRTTLDAAFEADLEMRTPAAYAIASECFGAACLLLALWRQWSIPYLVAVQAFAYLPGFLLLARASFRRLRPAFAFDPALWRKLLWMSLPVGLANLFIIAYSRSDILMLGWMSAGASVGLYAAAHKLTGSLGLFPSSVTASLLPLMAEAHGAGDRERMARMYRGAFSAVTAAGLPLAVGGSLFAPEIVRLVYGQAYASAAGALRVLVWAALFNFVLYVLTTTALAVGRERLFTAYAGLLVLLNVALNALLIPRYDFVGVSWATFIAEGLLMAAGVAILRREVGLPDGGAALRSAGAAAAAGALLVWLPAPMAVRLTVAGGLYAAFLYWGRGLSPEGLSALRSLFRLRAGPAPGER